MRHKRLFLVFATMLSLVAAKGWALEKTDGVYRIATSQDLEDFAALVNGGERTACAVLTADIVYSGGKQIAATGSASSGYAGTFDGQGHKVTVNITGTSTSGTGSLFGYNSGVIKNLIVDGNITSPGKQAGGICSYSTGLVSNCVALVTIQTSVEGDGTHGGIVGTGYSNSLVDRCVFAGKIVGANTTECGGITGWASSGKSNVKNSLNVGTLDIKMNSESAAICRNFSNSNRYANNYYAEGFGGSKDTRAQSLTAEQIANGYAAYVLDMGQTLGSDAYPSPLSKAKVYAKGSCDASLATGFTNNAAEAAAHNWDGFVCQTCGKLNTEFVAPDAAGVYALATAEDLKWFAAMVNKGHAGMCARLTSDIDMQGVADFEMIGNDSNVYAGMFDGQHHAIKNLTLNRPSKNDAGRNVGLFGSIGAGSVIKNLVLDSSCSTLGYICVGGLAGHATNDGCWIQLEGIISQSQVAAIPESEGGNDDAGVGGLVGNFNDGCLGTVTNCAFTGKVSGASSAYMSGWFGSNQFTLKGCWSVADKPAETSLSKCFALAGGGGANVKLIDCAAMNCEQHDIVQLKAEDIANGTLCWAVNGGNTETPSWFQKLGTDEYPTLQGTDIVYRVGSKKCDGSDGDGFGFSNSNDGFTQDPHQIDPTTGLCTVCGQLSQDEEGFYTISTAKALLKFGEIVNAGSTSINGRLTADIDLAGETWVPIGNDDAMYGGTFDGGQHKISNLVLVSEEQTSNSHPIGFFGTVTAGANLKDFYLDETCSFTGNTMFMGGIAGHSSNSGHVYFTGLGFGGTLTNKSTVSSAAAGGMIGNANDGSIAHFSFCWTAGQISGEKDVAAINAWFGGTNPHGTMDNCWTTAELNRNNGANKYMGDHGNLDVTNCFSLYGSQGTILEGYTADDLATGALCFRFNGEQSNIQWYQTLGEDKFPLPWDTHKRVYPDGPVRCDGTPERNIPYSNTPNDNLPTHDYEHGICTICSMIDADYLKPNDGGYFELADGMDVAWFSKYAMLNSQNSSASAVLTEDIDMTEGNKYFTPLTNYSGTFDGQGHTISNFVLVKDEREVGFFRFVRSGMVLRNVIFDSSCVLKGTSCVAPISCSADGESGRIIIEKVGFEGTVTAEGVNGSGLIGCNHGSSAIYRIVDCYVKGTINGLGGESGPISGWVGNSASTEISNCWSAAEITGSNNNYVYDKGGRVPNAKNLFVTEGSPGTKIETADLVSGRLAWLLNAENFLDATWFQNIGDDLHPVFDATHGLVYQTEEGFASVDDEDTYLAFREYLTSRETKYCEEAVACQAVISKYAEEVEKWQNVETLEAFLPIYKNSLPLKADVLASETAYADYTAVCEGFIQDLATSSVDNEQRKFLEAYLDKTKETAPGEYPNGSYAYILSTHTLTDAQIAEEAKYVKGLMTRVIGSDVPAGTDITALLENPDLKDGFNGWTMQYEGNVPSKGGEAFMPAAEMQNNTRFDMQQTLTGLKNGIYELRANAAFRPYGIISSTWSAGALYMNDNMNYVTTESEDILLKADAVDGENCHLTGDATDLAYISEEIEGWVPRGTVGCSYAFRAGRYQNVTAVEVKDGTLTVGIRNMGTGLADDWMGFGNFRLAYLGTAEEASERLDNVLTGYKARAQAVVDFLMSDASDANQYPNISAALKTQLTQLMERESTTGEEKLAKVNEYSRLFADIQECRRAYADMASTMEEVMDEINVLGGDNLIGAEESKPIWEKVNKGWVAYEEGTFDTEQARALTAELLEKPYYPAKEEDGTYVLETPQHMGIFAYIVNTGQYDANAKMAADLDMQGIKYTPIGFNLATNNSSANSSGALYHGHFDGQGHHISNLLVDKPNSVGVGLFGDIKSPAHIENFVLESTCVIYGDDRAGVVGRSYGTGDITLNNIGNEGNVFCDRAACGILGNANNSSRAIISNCYSTGLLSPRTESLKSEGRDNAQICGWLANLGAQVTNCWSTAVVYSHNGNSRAFCDVGGDNNKFTNDYSTFATQAQVKSKEAFQSGEVTYGLNNENTEDVTWFQTIGSDEHPVFAGEGHLVVNKNSDGTFYNLEDAIRTIAQKVSQNVSVYDVKGHLLRSNVAADEALNGLQGGLYIMRGTNGKSMKVLVR